MQEKGTVPNGARYDSPEGIVAGVVDKNGVVHITDGQHRVNAAIEIAEETGDNSYLNRLLDSSKKGIGGRSYLQNGPKPSDSRKLPRRR